MTTETPAKLTIFEALAAVMGEVQAVGKGDRNTQQNYKFRGIDTVVNAVGPVFRKYGVIAVPILRTANYRDVQTSTGKPSRECTVEVAYRFYGPDGSFVETVVPGESMDFGDKGAPKAMSVAYRIALLQTLCIPTDDPEPDSQSYEREAPARQPARVQPMTREQIVTKAHEAITAAGNPTALERCVSAVASRLAEQVITPDDARSLNAAIEGRRVEMESQLVGAGA